MDKKKSILIYSDFLPKISKLSDEQAGKLFKGLLNYSNGITPEFDDVLLDYAFEDIKTTIDRDTEKYSLKCLKNKEIALERERIKRERNSTNVDKRTQVITNSTDKDIDIDIDIDSDILLKKETKEENLSKENPTEIFPQSESVETGEEKGKEKEETNTIDFDKLLSFLNSKIDRDFKLVNKKVQGKYLARLKEGYTKKDILDAISNAVNSDFHKEHDFKYLTPEFFSRSETLDKYSNVNNKQKENNVKSLIPKGVSFSGPQY